MNLLQLFLEYNTEEQCWEYIEKIIWKGEPKCSHCNSKNIRKRNKEIGRWHCRDCNTSFRSTYGTLFHNTKMPLQKWFHAILRIAGENTPTSKQLTQELNINQKTAWSMMRKIQNEMENENDQIIKYILAENDVNP